MINRRAKTLAAAALWLVSCQASGTGPVTLVPPSCADPNELALPRLSRNVHTGTDTLAGKTTTLDGVEWATGAEVQAFFGTKNIKVVFTIHPDMYLLTYETGEAHLTLISHGDESTAGMQGAINSPLFSPDGKLIVYAGGGLGKPAFIQQAVAGEGPALRVVLDPKAHPTADPHWYVKGDSTFVYFSTLAGLVNYSADCNQISGATYRVPVLDDKTVGPIGVSGIPGSYRGGISKDGNWIGTSYAQSAIYDRANDKIHLIGDDEQQCNPSMNPYPIGSAHMDYMMILAFGGVDYHTIDGSKAFEGLHENLWIYNKDNKIVWQGKRPDEKAYTRYDKPEWSTHPNYATAIALQCETCGGDLFAVKIGDLANAEEGKVNQAQGYLRIGKGHFNSESFSHLWVGQ